MNTTTPTYASVHFEYETTFDRNQAVYERRIAIAKQVCRDACLAASKQLYTDQVAAYDVMNAANDHIEHNRLDDLDND